MVLVKASILVGIAIALSTGATLGQIKTRDMGSTTSAGSTTVDRAYKGVDTSKNTSVGVGATTIYTQPGSGGSGPVQGTQRGSTSSPSGGIMFEYRY